MILSNRIVLCIILITLVSLGLKLYHVDFSIPFVSDNLGYTLRAIAHQNGDFSQTSDKGIGWSLFISPFLNLINSDSLVDYSNVVRILSLSIATVSIPVVYLVGKKFFDEKYSLVMASLFAFEPHLNYNSGLGLAEPMFNLAILGAFYFILNNKTKFIIPSLALAAICWWIRINGIGIFLIISIIYFITQRKHPHLLRNYGLGLVIFILIISPMLIQRNDQFGDPLYFWYNDRLFAGNYEMLVSNDIVEKSSAFDYIQKNDIVSFLHTFVLQGILNIFDVLSRISFPYLFILLPFGIAFSFRAFDQNSQYIRANWIFILSSLSLIIITFSIVPERRYLFFIYPFLIIFATIPIQRLVEYGLSTFSFTIKQKNIALILIVCLVFGLSLSFIILQYERPDPIYENEKLELATFIVNNLHGKMLDDSGPALEYVSYMMINDPEGNFKNYRMDKSSEYLKKQTNVDRIYIYAQSIEDLVSKGESFNLKYLVSNKQKGYFHQYVDTIYDDEEKYPFLKKVFDSNDYGFTKLKVKIFEIDYEKFSAN